jgi:hypothetical protein
MKFECLSRSSCRAPPPAEQATTADAAKIGSLPLKKSGLNRAQVGTCFVVSARVATSRPVRAILGSHNVFLSYGRGSTGRAVAPPSAPTPQLNEIRRGRNAASVAGFSRVTFREQRFWVFCLQLKEKVGAGATALEPGGRLGGRGASRARAGTVRAAGASRHRAARAREVWAMES